MKLKRIIYICIVLGLVASALAATILVLSRSKYTAQTFIRVLPYAKKDPMVIGTPPIDKDIQYGFRVSMATFIKQQSFLHQLANRDKIQDTQWFKDLGDTKAERIFEAAKDLEDNLNAYTQRDGDFIVVSMTCNKAEDAALIVNEMVNLFITSQAIRAKEEITNKLTKLEGQRSRLQRDLLHTENALDDVRRKPQRALTDLEERSCPHPVTVRLNHLQCERDNCFLEVKQLEANIKNLEKEVKEAINEQAGNEQQDKIKNAQNKLALMQSKLQELEKMLNKAEERKKEYDQARILYEQRAAVRDKTRKRLDEINELIEKLRIMHDDPETCKVQSYGLAPVPLEPGLVK